MNSRYNGYTFPLRDTVTREKYAFTTATASNWRGTCIGPGMLPGLLPPWRWPGPSGR